MDDKGTLPVPVAGVGYDADFYAWTQDQGRKLRAGCFSELDMSNLAEEIESRGRSEKRELTNRLAVLLTHLLKWTLQPARRSRSWTNTIGEQRDQAELLLRDNPSLRPLLPEIVADAYWLGRRSAIGETNISADRFPVACPWDNKQVLDETFLPGPFSSP